MRRLLVVVVCLLAIALVPVRALTTNTEGYYEFEDNIANASYSGVWTTPTVNGVTYRNTSGTSAQVQYQVSGKHMVLYRLLRNGTTSTMNVCVNVTCVTVTNQTTGTELTSPVVISLTGGGAVDTITIVRTVGPILIDAFMILSEPGTGVPTPVPTATAIPTSTPAYTATPGPTPVSTATAVPTSTPAPTTTPYGVIWALDPARQYGEVNGHITSVEYSATAADIQLGNLLTTLLFSVWGMFFFGLFVLVRYKKK